MTQFVGAQDGLSSERAYTLRTLPAGVLRRVGAALRGQADGLGRAAAIAGGFTLTALGYGRGRAGTGSAAGSCAGLSSACGGSAGGGGGAMMRLLMVTPRYFPLMGGVETHVHEVARRLARRGVDVTVLTTNPAGELPSVEDVEGVTVRRVRAWPANRDYYFAPEIGRIVQEGEWDLVHLQSYHTLVAPITMAAARRAHVPYVVTFHPGGHTSQLRNRLRGVQQLLLRPLLAGAERLIAVARFELEMFSRRLHLPHEKFVHIPNGCDIKAPDHGARLPCTRTARSPRWGGWSATRGTNMWWRRCRMCCRSGRTPTCGLRARVRTSPNCASWRQIWASRTRWRSGRCRRPSEGGWHASWQAPRWSRC